MRRAERLRARLQQAFQPVAVEIIDESGRHAGHQEHFDGSGETHLRIRIVADAFAGMSRVERHRAVNRLAAEELAAGLHALAIEAKTPAEAGR